MTKETYIKEYKKDYEQRMTLLNKREALIDTFAAFTVLPCVYFLVGEFTDPVVTIAIREQYTLDDLHTIRAALGTVIPWADTLDRYSLDFEGKLYVYYRHNTLPWEFLIKIKATEAESVLKRLSDGKCTLKEAPAPKTIVCSVEETNQK